VNSAREQESKLILGTSSTNLPEYQIGNGKSLWSWSYRDDVIFAHFLAAQALIKAAVDRPSPDMRVDGQGFLITDDEHIEFWEFARRIADAAGYPTDRDKVTSLSDSLILTIILLVHWLVWTVSLGRRKSHVEVMAVRSCMMTRTFNINKAKSILGYKAIVSLADGIERAGGSFRERNTAT
jgi:sterol-4alpha-carboxylate 3-dehydrogenase (decarboxylating)